MTNDEIQCNICEDYIADQPIYDEDKDAYIGKDGIAYETLGDALSEIDELGLWNEESDIFVCMGCVTLSYEVANGAPIRKRIRMTISDWRWRWYRWRHKTTFEGSPTELLFGAEAAPDHPIGNDE